MEDDTGQAVGVRADARSVPASALRLEALPVDAPHHGRRVAEELLNVLFVAVGGAPVPVARRRLLARAKLSTAPALV